MSTPERQQDAESEEGVGYGANAASPDTVGAEEIEMRRQAEQDEQRDAGDGAGEGTSGDAGADAKR